MIASFKKHIQDPRRQKTMYVRTQVEYGVREFFLKKDFIETRTPLLVACPGMETHIRPMEMKTGSGHRVFLPTSPEFAMKRLLVGGLERIFQMCPAFRDEPESSMHSPEFLMLEWYRANAEMEEVMKDTEELFEYLAKKILGTEYLNYQGKKISVKTPWPRLKVKDLFFEMVGIDLARTHEISSMQAECKRLGLSFDSSATWDDLYFLIWLNCIENKLPENQAVFVVDYPPSQSALAEKYQDDQGNKWARRFEVYAGGLELCNAFQELTDVNEQIKRFEEDMNLREKIYGKKFPKNPIDDEFLNALREGLPRSSGNALGVDRLVMLLADEPVIEKTLWLPSFWPKSNGNDDHG